VNLIAAMRAEQESRLGGRPFADWIAEHRDAVAAGIRRYQREDRPKLADALRELTQAGDER
jgi:hypothetical protein